MLYTVTIRLSMHNFYVFYFKNIDKNYFFVRKDSFNNETVGSVGGAT